MQVLSYAALVRCSLVQLQLDVACMRSQLAAPRKGRLGSCAPRHPKHEDSAKNAQHTARLGQAETLPLLYLLFTRPSALWTHHISAIMNIIKLQK